MMCTNRFILPAIILTSLMSVGCGEGSDELVGFESTATLTYGRIIHVNDSSVMVNGVLYGIGQAKITVDDQAADSSALDPGMVVTLTANIENDRSNGTASHVRFEYDISGPITGIVSVDPGDGSRRFDILNTPVVADPNRTVFSTRNDAGFSFGQLTSYDIIAISGFYGADGTLHASYIETLGTYSPTNPENIFIEVSGEIVDISESYFDLENGLWVKFDLSTTDMRELNGGLKTRDNSSFGTYMVKVDGTYIDDTTVYANKITPGKVLPEVAQNISVEGIVTRSFSLDNLKLDKTSVNAAETVTFIPGTLGNRIENGMKIQIEGSMDGGILQARKVTQRSGYFQVAGIASHVGEHTISLEITADSYIDIIAGNNTIIQDHTGSPTAISIGQISSGDYLVIDAYEDIPGSESSAIRSTHINRLAAKSQVILQGTVSTGAIHKAPGQESITLTLHGIEFVADHITTDFFGSNNEPLTASDFYTAIQGQVPENPIINIRDNFAPGTTYSDGIADRMAIIDKL